MSPVGTFEIVLVLLGVVIALHALALKLRLPPATALLVGGGLLAFVPGLPHVELDPELAFLNTGSLGASPKAVEQAVQAAIKRVDTNPLAEGFGKVLNEAEQSRQVFADLFNCKLDEICLTRNTTDGMNLVAEGLNLQPGDHVLTSNREHPGGLRCWEALAKRRGVIVEGFESADETPTRAHPRAVTTGYMRAMELQLVSGRAFTAADGPGAPRVAIINETMARRYWPNGSPIGRRVSFTGGLPRGRSGWR